MRSFSLLLFLLAPFELAAESRPVKEVIADYVKAVGGQEAVDKLGARRIEAVEHRVKVTFYWQKPNHVLEADRRERMGFDGTRSWELSAKGKVKKLTKGAELPMEMVANPLRFVHMSDLYSEVNAAPAEQIDDEAMDVLIAPNNLAATKLYFDAKTHLLRRVVESGEISAYFKNTFDFLDYRDVDGVRMPFRIVHSTEEPGGRGEDYRIKEITHNVDLREEMFSKPLPAKMVMGGKH